MHQIFEVAQWQTDYQEMLSVAPLFGRTGESPYTVTTHDLIVRELPPKGQKFKSFKMCTLVEYLDSLLFHTLTTVSTDGVHTTSVHVLCITSRAFSGTCGLYMYH